MKSIPGSVNEKGMFTAKNPFALEKCKHPMTPLSCSLNESCVCRDLDKFSIDHPELFCYTPSNVLVTDEKHVEVVGPVWQYKLKQGSVPWRNCDKSVYDLNRTFEDVQKVIGGECDLRKVYITIPPTEKISLADEVGRDENMPDIANYIYSKVPTPEHIEWAKGKVQEIKSSIPEAQPLEGVKMVEAKTMFNVIDGKTFTVDAKCNSHYDIKTVFQCMQEYAEAYHAQFATDAGGGEELLRKAFEAGGDFANECKCNECEYCAMNLEKSPDFETWYAKQASSTHSSSEIVENIKLMFMQWNHSYDPIGLHHSFITQYPISDDNIRITTSTHDYVVFDAAGTWFLASIIFVDGEPNEEWTKQFNSQKEAKDYAENILITQIRTKK